MDGRPLSSGGRPQSTPTSAPQVRFQDTFCLDNPEPQAFSSVPTLSPTRIKISPQEYSGRQSWRLYCRHYEAVARVSGWTEEMKAIYLVPFLRGTALAYYDTLAESVRQDFAKLSAAFHGRFSDRMERTTAHIKLRGCVQGPRETLKEYVTRVQELAALAFENDAPSTREAVALAQMIDGIADGEIQQRVRDTLPASVEEALAFAEQIEASREATRICRRHVRAATADLQTPMPLCGANSPHSSSGRPGITRTRRINSPPESPRIETGVRGKIRVYLEGRRFGFITREDNGENVFMHIHEVANIPRNAQVHPREGDEVTFDVVWTRRTPAARNVVLLFPPRGTRDAERSSFGPGHRPVASSRAGIPSTSRDEGNAADLNGSPLTYRA